MPSKFVEGGWKETPGGFYELKRSKVVISATEEPSKTKTKKETKKAAKSLKEASKTVVSKSADEARAAAAKRATLTAPSNRTPAQNIAIARTTGGIAGAGAKKVNPVYRMMGRGGGAGGAFIENLK